MAEIITVSITTKQKQWLLETKSSPSKMIQEVINEEMRAANEWLAPNLKEARARIARLTMLLEEARENNNQSLSPTPDTRLD